MPAAPDKSVDTIAIRNPRVLEVVGAEVTHGTGRNFVEAAENMILADAERRQVARAMASARRPRGRRKLDPAA